MNKGSIRARVMVGFAAVAVIAAACSSSGASTAPSADTHALALSAWI